MLDYLKEKADKVAVLSGEYICRQAGSAKVLNAALLGAAAASGALDISIEEMGRAVKENVKEKYQEMNHKALELGKAAFEQI